MSKNSSQVGAFPMGSGILFAGDNISLLENTEPFHSFTLNDYLQWREKRVHDLRPLQEFEPIGYFDMESAVKIVDKVTSKKPCKYIKLVPTGFKKTTNNSFPQERFSSYPVEFEFFGVVGEELDAKISNEDTSDASNASSLENEICDTGSSFKIEMYNKFTKSWEEIHQSESKIYVHDIQTCGINFNISLMNLDKITSYLSGNKLTGLFKNKITNSKIQINMIGKLRVVVESQATSGVDWKLCGFKLLPKALINMESNSEGIFSKVPMKHLRSCILDPEYFDLINKEIVFALTDDDIDLNIKLRAIRTLSLIISLNSKMIPLIFKNLDLNKFMKLLYQQDSRGCRYIVELFRKFYEAQGLVSQISDTVIDNISNIHKITMTHSSLEAFMNLLSCHIVNRKEEVFKILFETLYYKISKEAVRKLQIPEYTVMRKLVDNNSYPFDMTHFSNQSETLETKGVKDDPEASHFEKLVKPIAYNAKYSKKDLVKEYDIELSQQSQVKEIRLLFDQVQSKPYRFSVKIYGGYRLKEEENLRAQGNPEDKMVLLFSNTYDEAYYCYLTQNSYIKEHALYDENEERESLSVNNLNFVGTHLKIHITFYHSFMTLNGQHPVVEHILPEIYGEARTVEKNKCIIEYEKEEITNTTRVTVGHSTKFVLQSIKDQSFKVLKCCPEETPGQSVAKTEAKTEESKSKTPQSKEELVLLQDTLKELLWKHDTAPSHQRNQISDSIANSIQKIESLKSMIKVEKSENDEIVPSLEYQMCLASKFSQLLISLYKSDSETFTKILQNYPLEELVYELYVCYIIDGSQTSNSANKHQNIHSNDIWMLIKNVLLPSIKDQGSIDKLVIKILNEFILKTNPIYSQARIIESLESLPYSYDKVIAYAYENLYQDPERIKTSRDILQVFENQNEGDKAKYTEENSNIVKLLMTVLALNNLKEQHHEDDYEKISSTLKHCYNITDWLIKNVTLKQANKQFLLRLTLDLMVYLLKISKEVDYVEIISSNKFLTQLTMTIFLMNNKTHSQYLAKIFELFLDTSKNLEKDQITALSDTDLKAHTEYLQNKLVILEQSFKFWQNFIKMLLNDQDITKHYTNKSNWVENLIFSIDLYLSSIEKLNSTVKHIEMNNSVLKIDEEYITISKINPEFSVVQDLVTLLKQYGTPDQKTALIKIHSNSHLTTLWSLMFETLACIDSEEVKKQGILNDLITTLFSSSIQLQEVTYLVQTSFRISPNAQFLCTLLFNCLDKAIGTKHEETVYSLCDKWLEVLLKKPFSEVENFEDVEIAVKFEDLNDIVGIFESTSGYLVKYLNYSNFSGIVGANPVTFKKASIIADLFVINRATNGQGELMIEKAFVQARDDPEIRQRVEKGFRNIITWLFLSSGEHTGPIEKYIKQIETQCRFLLVVASDTKDCSFIDHVIKIYNLLMKNIEDLLVQSKIPIALAFSKSKAIHQTLESIFEYLVVSDEIAKYFVFEQKGFDYFLNLLMSTKKKESIAPVEENEEETIDTSSKNTAKKETPTSSKTINHEDIDINDELMKYVSSKLNSEHEEVNSEAKQDDIPVNPGYQNRNVTSADFVLVEFGRTMTLADSNMDKVKEQVTNMDWSVNKKGYRQRLVYQKYGAEHNNEVWMVFKLNRVVEIKEIQIGFTNFWTNDTEIYIEPSSVIVEAGLNEKETHTLCSLEKIDDKGFNNFGVTVYGLNMYAFNKQSNSDNLDDLINSNFSSLQTLKARYLKFKIRNNSITCLENSPLINKYMKPK